MAALVNPIMSGLSGVAGNVATGAGPLGYAANEAAMLALTPTVAGQYCMRQDLENALYVWTGSDPTQASSWVSTVGSSTGASFIETYATDAELETARGNSALTAPAWYFTSTDGSVFLTTAANAAIKIYGTGPEYKGADTFANLKAYTGLEQGDTALATDVGSTPGTILIYTGTKWRTISKAIIGKTIATETSPITSFTTTATTLFTGTGATVTIPANLLGAGSAIRVMASISRSSVTADASGMSSVVYLGTAGTTSDSLIVSRTFSTNTSARGSNNEVIVQFATTGSAMSWYSVPFGDVSDSLSNVDVSTNINTTAAMVVSVGVSGTDVPSATYKLNGLWVEVIE